MGVGSAKSGEEKEPWVQWGGVGKHHRSKTQNQRGCLKGLHPLLLTGPKEAGSMVGTDSPKAGTPTTALSHK